MKKTLVCLTLCTIIGLVACKSDKEEKTTITPVTCVTTTMSYATHVAPIIANKCTNPGCHLTATAGNNNIGLTTYDGVKAATVSGKLIGAINHSAGYSAMPSIANKIEQCSINQIEAWKTQGYTP